MQIIRSSGTEVSVHINDQLTNLQMKLGRSGEAYFVDKASGQRKPSLLTQSTPGLVGTSSAIPISRSKSNMLTQSTSAMEDHSEMLVQSAPTVLRSVSADVLSKGEKRGKSEEVVEVCSAPNESILSELEKQDQQQQPPMEWNWGQLPRKSSATPHTAAAMLVASPVVESPQISLCASLLSKLSELDSSQSARDVFDSKIVSFERFSQEPSLLFSPELVVRIKGRMYPWSVAGPMLASEVFFGQGLDVDTVARLETAQRLTSPMTPIKKDLSSLSAPSTPQPQQQQPQQQQQPEKKSSWWFRKSWLWSSKKADPVPTEEDSNSYYKDDTPEEDDNVVARALFADERGSTSVPSLPASASTTDPLESVAEERGSLCPTSEQLKSLGLKSGCNKVTFSVITGLRGIQTVSCNLFLWDNRTPIVISDVDGTITRSDVPGMFLPYVGRDWSQSGVASLFNRIRENGYNILYLTARSVGQANSTRGFICNLTQNSMHLPAGPVFMSPDRLLPSFSREVIERKPEEFKISCLGSVRSLYPADFNPFYGGFGNRPSDVNSYNAVGIPSARIFIINPMGTVTATNNVTYKKTYTDLSVMCNEVFPPKQDHTIPDAFGDALFWRDPSLDWPIEV